MRGATTLNSVSRSLSEVGRSSSQVGVFSRRPLSEPAITRILGNLELGIWNLECVRNLECGRECQTWNAGANSKFQIPNSKLLDLALPDLDKFEPILPRLQQLPDLRRGRGRPVEPSDRFAPGDLEQFAIPHEIDHPERRQAGLPRPEEITRAAET